jgi:cysteate synthase
VKTFAYRDTPRWLPIPEYTLRCSGCAATFPDDDGLRLECSHDHPPALLRSEYAEKRFVVGSEPSVLRYREWLPLRRPISTVARTGIYRSQALADRLGLSDLWIAFNGWWPERGATVPTGTFKDLEAFAVLGRFPSDERRPLVVASAGNTAAAFADACTANELPVLLVVPLDAWGAIASNAAVGPTVRTVAIANAQYDDAIAFARRLAATGEVVFEGGVRNVARRDGMGTTMLAAAETLGRLPDVYVQAVGSAAGALAVHEAAARLIGDGRYGTQAPRLVLAQNAPFSPIHDAWSRHSDGLAEISDAEARDRIAEIGAPVLSNRTPPYAVSGGVHDALSESGGITFGIDNAELAAGADLFGQTEGPDLDPAAAVAVAALARAVRERTIASDERVLLHITGGGRKQLAPKNPPGLRPSLVIERADLDDIALERARRLVAAISV